MVAYSYTIKQLLGFCSDYSLDAQIQKKLFILDLWVPKAAREIQIENVAQQYFSSSSYFGYDRSRSPIKTNKIINKNTNLNKVFQRKLGVRSISAEVFHGTTDIGNRQHFTVKNEISYEKLSNDGNSDEKSQAKLLPILEGGENEDKNNGLSQSKSYKSASVTTKTFDWTPNENDSISSVNDNRICNDALFELSIRADSVLKNVLFGNTTNILQIDKNTADRITLRKSVSVINEKQKAGNGRPLIRANSDTTESDASRKCILTHISRASERYFSDDPKVLAEIEEFEIEYLFNYIRHLKTYARYANMKEDEILQEVESDSHTLRQRTKEILKGKMSDSYAVYITKYPIKKQRQREHPVSPNKYRKCSRRCFDGQLRTWRRNLHQFDNIDENDKKALNNHIDTTPNTTTSINPTEILS